jgi:hypothetical protein
VIVWIGLRNLRTRAFHTLITVAVVAAATATALVVPMILRQVDRGATEAVQVFDLLVTAKGSQTQAVLSTLFYLDAPIGNVPYAVYVDLADDPRTHRAVPIGLGDSFRGHPIVGTDDGFFDLRLSRTAPPYFRVDQGRGFEAPFEAVLGAQVARDQGLAVGARFTSTHGMIDLGLDGVVEDPHDHDGAHTGHEDDHEQGEHDEHEHDDHEQDEHDHDDHDDEHGHGDHDGEEHDDDHDHAAAAAGHDDHDHAATTTDEAAARAAVVRAQQALDAAPADADRGALRAALAHALEDLALATVGGAGAGDGHVHGEAYEVVGILAPTGGPVDRAVLVDIESAWLVHGQVTPERRGVTAILYTAESPGDYYAVAQEIDAGPEAQAVFTGAVFGQLRGFVARGEAAYGALSALVLVLAALTVWLNVYSGALERRRSSALLRALGAGRAMIFTLVVLETGATVLAGIVVGTVAGYALTHVGGGVLAATLGFSVPPPAFDLGLVARVLPLVPLGLVAALVPAWQSSRSTPLDDL